MDIKYFISRPLALFRAFIDRTTMYKMVLYALTGLAAWSIALGALGLSYASAWSQLGSLALAVVLASMLSYVLALIFRVPANHESSIITALILFFLISPAESLSECLPMVIAVSAALISKYLVVYRKQHLVNAASLGVLALSLSGLGAASWWVATPLLFVPLVIAGVLVVTKVRRWTPVLAFILTGFAVFLFEEWRVGSDLGMSWSLYFLSYPALFLGFFMLTEPFTMPPTRRLQMGYGALVGFLSNTSVFMSFLVVSPELALIIGNLAAYPFTLRRKLQLHLLRKTSVADSTWEFEFAKPPGFRFTPGQYLEWMLPHQPADSRGIRRYFTIASAPSEATVKLAVKLPVPGSSYKTALSALPVGGLVIGSQLAGDFVLPQPVDIKIGMIAGGIGVTPFRSQIQSAIDTHVLCDTILFYACNTKADLAYRDTWMTATRILPFKLVAIFAKEPVDPEYEIGYFSDEILKRQSPDFLERSWYVSGPPPMVNATVRILSASGVSSKNIVGDFFPGLA